MVKNPPKNRQRILALKKLARNLVNNGLEEKAEKILSIARSISDRTIIGGLPPSNILQDLCNFLNECKIKFAVIRGLAVCVRGQMRSTEDIDVLVSTLPGNDKLRDADYMGRFNFYKAKSSTGTILVLDHKSSVGYAELLLATDNIAQWILSTATNENILNVMLPVISAEALIVNKIKASTQNPNRRQKDFPDILSILLKNKINLEVVQKFLDENETEVLKKLVNSVT